jgi:hypothetical protein
MCPLWRRNMGVHQYMHKKYRSVYDYLQRRAENNEREEPNENEKEIKRQKRKGKFVPT